MARLTAITALIGALIVIISQLVTAYALEDPFGNVIATVNLLDKHGIVTALFGLAAALALVFAIATGSRAAAIVIIGLGAAVVLVFLIVDVPDIGNTGLYNSPGSGNLDAIGKAAAGLWLELTGGVILILSGIALSTLSATQLRAIGPARSDRS
ncbi:MAG: hypothetical protein IPK93_06245 [Solirubrobacterales bacterium]|nr:hypothetical protein [Solirubrobacterales bacterium]